MAASDDFFAEKENLLRPERAVFIPGKFTERGKWMDGWESRRKREPGHDWCIVALGVAGSIAGVNVDTSHFNGNQPESCTIEGAECAPGVTDDELSRGAGRVSWREIVSRTPLGPNREHFIAALGHAVHSRFTHIRLNIFPDGGVARFRVFGHVRPDWETMSRATGPIDLAAAVNGGLVVAANDMHFGSRHNLIMPGRAEDMGDGWETRRKRGLTWGADGPKEHDWCIVRFGSRGTIDEVVVDTNHFKGNFPHSCRIEVCDAPAKPDQQADLANAPWRELLPRTRLEGDREHRFTGGFASGVAGQPVTHARLSIFPDGGVSRLRMLGRPAR
ncbi:MAG: allantoicase [Phycisphaerales bacterium]|nr:allantoicase [Phycisphaerales bacterium]